MRELPAYAENYVRSGIGVLLMRTFEGGCPFSEVSSIAGVKLRRLREGGVEGGMSLVLAQGQQRIDVGGSARWNETRQPGSQADQRDGTGDEPWISRCETA